MPLQKQSVGFAFAHPTAQGSRIAQIVETDNAESPRMVYINPIREQPHTYTLSTYTTNHGMVQYTLP